MLLACWSTKGGSGTTVVAVAIASMLARLGGTSLLVDLGGDVPPVLGLPDPEGPGISGWVAAGTGVPADALARLELAGPGGLRVLARGPEAVPGGPRADLLAALLAADARPVVADCGTGPSGAALAVALAATHSILVVRPCYLALRQVPRAPVRPTGVVVVVEHGRALGAADVEAVAGVPVVAEVPVDDAIARAVDAGTLGQRVPRPLQRALRHVG